MDDRYRKSVLKHFRRSRREKMFQVVFLHKTLKARHTAERKFIGVFEEFFKQQARSISSKIKRGFIKKTYQLSKKQVDVLRISFGEAVQKKKFEKIMKIFYSFLYDNSKKELSELFNHKIPKKTMIEEELSKSNYAKTEEGIMGFSLEMIKKNISKGFQEGRSLSEIAHDVQKNLGEGAYKRSHRIVRTESRIFSDQIALKAYEEVGIKHVDVVGCEQFEDDSDCGRQNVPLELSSSLRFHPNHIGVIVSSRRF